MWHLRSCRCECAGVSGHRCEGGGTGRLELPGPVLREGNLKTGSVPTVKHPGPGSSTEMSKCSSTHSPSPRAPTCPPTSGPHLFQPRRARAWLGPWLWVHRYRPQCEDAGPWPQGSCGGVRAPAALPARRPSTTRGGLCFCGRYLDLVAMGSRVRDREVQPQPLLVCGCKGRPCVPGGQMFFHRKILNFYMKHADF